MIEQRKSCNDCGEEKSLSEFYVNRACSDGYNRRCKSCDSVRCKKYRQTQAGRSKKLAIQLRYMKTPKGRAVDNKNGSMYRARKREQTCDCCEQREFTDVYYNTPDGYVVDHIIPLNRGGLHCLDNLQYLTVYDNSAKGDKLDYVTTGTVIPIKRDSRR